MGIQNSSRRIKIFEYQNSSVTCFCISHSSLRMMKLSGRMNSKENYFLFMEKNYSCVLAMCFDRFKRKERINKVSGNSVQGRNNLWDRGGRSLPKISVKNP